MTPWKYTDATQRVVTATLDNGNVVSCEVSTPEVQEWLTEGNTPLPADPVPIGMTDSYKAMIRRAADTLNANNQQIAAILLLKQIGE